MFEQVKIRKRFLTFLFYCALGFFAFLFLVLFSYHTTPFSNCDNGSDAAFYRLVGQGMTKGYLPYRDIFDMKGPFFYFVQYLGQLISYGRIGIFILQWINLFISVIIICKLFACVHINNRWLQLALLCPSAYVASFTFEGGNLTEEFSLVPLLSCLCIGLLYFDRSEEPSAFWQQRIYWYAGGWFGFCFGLLLMIRITNAALIGAIVFTIMLCLLKNRKYRQLMISAGMFLVGFLVAITPVCLFFSTKGMLYEVFRAVIIFGFKYHSFSSWSQRILRACKFWRTLPLLIIGFIPLLLRWKSWKEQLLVFFCTLFTFWGIVSGYSHLHYYVLTIPLVVISGIAIATSLGNKHRKQAIVAIFLSIAMLAAPFKFFKGAIGNAYMCLVRQDTYNEEYLAQDIASKIPQKDSESVFSYNMSSAWYTYVDLFPCIRYCDWQNTTINMMPEIYDELDHTFSVDPPAWLVLPESIGELPLFLEEKLKTNYQQVYENEKYILYHYNAEVSQ